MDELSKAERAALSRFGKAELEIHEEFEIGRETSALDEYVQRMNRLVKERTLFCPDEDWWEEVKVELADLKEQLIEESRGRKFWHDCAEGHKTEILLLVDEKKKANEDSEVGWKYARHEGDCRMVAPLTVLNGLSRKCTCGYTELEKAHKERINHANMP